MRDNSRFMFPDLLRATLAWARTTRTRGCAVPRRDAEGNEGSEYVRAWLQLLAAPPTLLRALDFGESSYAGTEGTSGGEERDREILSEEARMRVRRRN